MSKISINKMVELEGKLRNNDLNFNSIEVDELSYLDEALKMPFDQVLENINCLDCLSGTTKIKFVLELAKKYRVSSDEVIHRIKMVKKISKSLKENGVFISKKMLSINEFTCLIFPMFSTVNNYIDGENVYVNIPFDLLNWIKLYLSKVNKDEISNIFNLDEYKNDSKKYLQEISNCLNKKINDLSNEKYFNFFTGNIIIKYNQKDLDVLKLLDNKTFSQLYNLISWIVISKQINVSEEKVDNQKLK